tara:strand:- start:440 stop:1054 length:615 start_codon:yes stop_codon:yes gene_type:complete
MASKTDIANMALLRFGQKKIMSMDDEQKSARLCKQHYDRSRREVLRSHRWNFATTRIALTASPTTPLYRWSYQYALPEDFIRAIEINQKDIFDSVRHFAIENGMLLTDEDAVNLKYIYDEEVTTYYDALFVEALSLLLASRVVVSLTGKHQLKSALTDEYVQVTKELAQQIDAAENNPVIAWRPTDSRLCQSRRQGANYSPLPF